MCGRGYPFRLHLLGDLTCHDRQTKSPAIRLKLNQENSSKLDFYLSVSNGINQSCLGQLTSVTTPVPDATQEWMPCWNYSPSINLSCTSAVNLLNKVGAIPPLSGIQRVFRREQVVWSTLKQGNIFQQQRK